ncbi:MAG TPA: CaiB/BaiF CoA-transferase family protein [Pirellulales bacterium]|jgi:crotonobetainyl-CoA:carnitine CoA-transferase CaiB-like acyl-CoA transferase
MSGYPLAGLKVLDLSRVLAGPVATQILADLGADVVKVERPGSGDDTRQWGPPFLGGDGPSAYFLSCNRGKRSLALDLKHPAAREIVDRLIGVADVLVENFLPDALSRYGLTPERLATLNPRLVSCSISGFGRTGPLADVAGYDLVTQAGTGLMSITGEPAGPPLKVGVAMSDILTGLYTVISALAGLHGRGRDGLGGAFDLSLADCTLASLVNVVQSALVTGERPQRWGNAHPQIVPYESFETADGFLVIAVGNDDQWRKMCAAIEHDDWAQDVRFRTNADRVRHRSELLGLLRPVVRQRTRRHWQELLSTIGVPHGSVLAVDEALATPQVAAREMILPVVDDQGRSYSVIGSAIHYQGEPPRTAQAPPELGQHTDEVLRQWLTLDDVRISQLREQGVIA